MTTLPPPPGYKPCGKRAFRRLKEHERRLVATYAVRHGTVKTAEHYRVSVVSVRKFMREFNLWPR